MILQRKADELQQAVERLQREKHAVQQASAAIKQENDQLVVKEGAALEKYQNVGAVRVAPVPDT